MTNVRVSNWKTEYNCSSIVEVVFNKQGNSNDEVRGRMNKGRKATGVLNSILEEKNIRKTPSCASTN
ncbi:hypothetical protein HUJ04_006742 [Dendroctonus ponderosae]|nr:hypothetical protein HUJ04_006742 [Dendroctonus ponderosae]